ARAASTAPPATSPLLGASPPPLVARSAAPPVSGASSPTSAGALVSAGSAAVLVLSSLMIALLRARRASSHRPVRQPRGLARRGVQRRARHVRRCRSGARHRRLAHHARR